MKASSARQLNVRSDRAYRLAHAIARHKKLTTQQVVEQALETLAKAEGVEDADDAAMRAAEYERLLALAREYRKYLKPDSKADHDDMYDEDGLPI